MLVGCLVPRPVGFLVFADLAFPGVDAVARIGCVALLVALGNAFAGQKMGSLVAAWPMTSPFVSFFWSSSCKVAASMLAMLVESCRGAARAE